LEALGERLVNKENRFRQTVMLDKLYSKIHTNFRKGEWVILTLIPKSSPRPKTQGISEVDVGTLPGAEDFVLDSDFCCLVGDSAENTLAFFKAMASQLRFQPTLYQTRVGYETQEGVRMEREKTKRSHGRVEDVEWAGPGVAVERHCFKAMGTWTFTGQPASPARLLMYDSLEGGLGSIERANCPPGEVIQVSPHTGREYTTTTATLTLDGQVSAPRTLEIDDDGSHFGRRFGNDFDKFESAYQGSFVVSHALLSYSPGVAFKFHLTLKYQAAPGAGQKLVVYSAQVPQLENGVTLVVKACGGYSATVILPSFRKKFQYRYELRNLAEAVLANSPFKQTGTSDQDRKLKSVW